MKQQEIYNILNELAPFSDSVNFGREIGLEDNSGIIVETQEEIDSVLVTMDLTEDSLAQAISLGVKLIITHHPVIFRPIKKIQGKLAKLIKNGIGVISMHLNLDVNENGTDYWLYKGLGGKESEILQPFGNAGYGRLFCIQPITLEDFAKNASKVLKTDRIITYGNPKRVINKVASFCGAGLDVGEIYASKDADVLVSADVKHHVITEAVDCGKALVVLTHYASENYGLKKFAEILSQKLSIKVCFYEDEKFL